MSATAPIRAQAAATTAVSLDSVSKVYGSFAALRNVSATFPTGSSTVILGENGAGKSTLLRIIAGLITPTRGTAILSLQPPRMGRVHVIEMSSYQIDLTPSLDPTVGILLNVSEDHIDRHGTLDHYAAVKERLVAGVQEQGTAIVGVDDVFSRNIADRTERAGKRVVRISVRNPLADGIYVERETIVQAAGGARSEIARIGGIGSLRGLHNAQNAACASACALALGVSRETLQNGLRSFPGLAHRMEQVGKLGNVLFVNDSKGTNADAAAHALSSFADIFWIAGGKPKAGGITGLAEYFPRIRKAYLIGEAAVEFAGTLGDRVPHEISQTLDVAVAHAAKDAEASNLRDPVVLLSPACASFDQYRNFEIRGAAFLDLVNALPGIKPVV